MNVARRAVAGAGAFAFALVAAGCGNDPGPIAPERAPEAAAAGPPTRIGSGACVACHRDAIERVDRGAHARARVAVECEDCHGPASAHEAWARGEPGRRGADPARGLLVALAGSRPSDWRFVANATVATRVRPLRDRSERDACARCHSSATRIAAGDAEGEPIGQTHRIALIEEGLHHADGQPKSDPHPHVAFAQGAMHEAGVTCSDCHDPHTTALLFDGDALCTECHLATRYDVAAHDRHAEPRPSCVDCHARTALDDGGFRIDHAFRVPRPDIAEAVGAPDACRACHEDRDAAWVSATLGRWFPGSRNGGPHWALALHAGRAGLGDPGEALSIVARDPQQPAIVRASALALLARYPDPRDAPLVAESARDAESLVRRAAAAHLATLPPDARARVAEALLADPVRDVRYAAQESLAPIEAALPETLRVKAAAVAAERSDAR